MKIILITLKFELYGKIFHQDALNTYTNVAHNLYLNVPLT